MSRIVPGVNSALRVTGTTDDVEIAAVLAAVSSVLSRPQLAGYELWRRRRLVALRATSP